MSKGERVPRKPTRREQLFNEAVKRERAATRKIKRIQATTGAKIQGTHFDPRMNDTNLLKTMNGRELRSHILKVNKFINRTTQFVAGVKGSPIPRSRWETYESEQKKFNAKANAYEKARAGIALPGDKQDMTIGQRNKDMQPEDPRRANVNHRTMQPLTRNVSGIKNASGLEKLIKDMKDKNSATYMKRSLENRMNSARALLKGAGYEDLMAYLEGGIVTDEEGNDTIVAPMTQSQLDLLLNYSTFGETAADRFASGTDEEAERDEQDRDYNLRNGDGSREADIRDQLLRVIDWAKTTQIPNPEPDDESSDTPGSSRKRGGAWTNPRNPYKNPTNPWKGKRK